MTPTGDHVLAIDQGTTGTTVLLLDRDLTLKAKGYREFRQIYPQPGWVEHDAVDIWSSVTGALGDCLAAAGPAAGRIAGIGITNQRETSLFWRDFLEAAFGHVGRRWQDHVRADPRYLRPAEVDALQGDASKARAALGWSPTVGFEELVRTMVEVDLESLGDPGRG